MKIVNDLFSFQSGAPCVVTIGKFDGIHPGHRELIRRTCGTARRMTECGERCLSAVFTFDMTPLMILSGQERREILEEMGVDVLIECPFDPGIIAMEPEDFIRDVLHGRLRAVCVVTGEDFRFGYRRRGDGALLAEYGQRYGYRCETVPEVCLDGRKISSSDIRTAVLAGDMETAEKLLGTPYFVSGKIIHGARIGRTIGIPTANIIPEKNKLLPPNGVYFSEAEVEGTLLRGITNVGTKPTVDGHFVGAETYFLDFDGDIYGEKLVVKLRHFSRSEKKFDSLEELKERILLDREEAEAFFA